MGIKVRVKCAGCGQIFPIDPPLCGRCTAHTLHGKPGGIVGWVPYVMVKLEGVGPFHTALERDAWYANMLHTNPELRGQRVDCMEEVVSDPAYGKDH